MPLVTVKQKYQVTIPETLRESMDLKEGDLLDATLVEGGILLRPKPVVDRKTAAALVREAFARIVPTPEDANRTEDEVMQDVIAEIDAARAEERARRK